MALSNQLRNIANMARDQASQQQGLGMAQVGMQAQQAMAQSQAGPQGQPPGQPTKAGAQQLAGGITQAKQEVLGQVAGQEQQVLGQLGQQALQQQQGQQQLKLQEQQGLNDTQIDQMQRAGQLRQNSANLKQAKQLQQDEIAMNARLVSSSVELDNNLSFLTRKQRTDLANLGQYTKQQLFDNRITFAKDELGRKFTNQRQLADYAVSSAQSDEQLAQRMQDMTQSAEKDIMALQQANDMISSRLKLEYNRAEQAKDYTLLKELASMKAAMDRAIARKKSRSAVTGLIVKAAVTLGAAYIGASVGAPAAVVGAATGVTPLGAGPITNL